MLAVVNKVEVNMRVPKKLKKKIDLSHDPAIPVLSIYPKELKLGS